MTDQMICRAFDVAPLPGADDRMWRKIDEKLRERGKEGWILYGKRRSPLPVMLAATLVVVAALLVIFFVRRLPANSPMEPLPAATPELTETVEPEAPAPTKTPEERQREHQQLEEEEALYESRLPDPHDHAHQWVWDSYNTIIASCVSPGYKYYTCSVCGLRTEREYQGEHTFAYQKTDYAMATGIFLHHRMYCSVCFAEFGVFDHQYVYVPGEAEYVCSLCGAVKYDNGY